MACRNENMKRSIYVVDDQAPVLETTVLVLRSLGRDWDVTGFTDPFAALAAVKANAPDAILSDELMPGMQGSQFLEQVRIASPEHHPSYHVRLCGPGQTHPHHLGPPIHRQAL